MTREEAIDVLKHNYPSACFTDLCEAVEIAIQALSAQPERKKGEWIVKDNPGTGWYRVTCSECGEDVTSVIPMIGFFPNAKALWDFCPDCGADMRGKKDG